MENIEKLTATGSLGSTNSTDAIPIGDWISPVMVGCIDDEKYLNQHLARKIVHKTISINMAYR